MEGVEKVKQKIIEECPPQNLHHLLPIKSLGELAGRRILEIDTTTTDPQDPIDCERSIKKMSEIIQYVPSLRKEALERLFQRNPKAKDLVEIGENPELGPFRTRLFQEALKRNPSFNDLESIYRCARKFRDIDPSVTTETATRLSHHQRSYRGLLLQIASNEKGELKKEAARRFLDTNPDFFFIKLLVKSLKSDVRERFEGLISKAVNSFFIKRWYMKRRIIKGIKKELEGMGTL